MRGNSCSTCAPHAFALSPQEIFRGTEQSVLALEPQVIAWSESFARKENALFLGRGLHYPIALEGALWGAIKAHGLLPDTVIVRSDGRPTYNFVSPVDDVFEKKIFGTALSLAARSSNPPVSPVTGSFSG